MLQVNIKRLIDDVQCYQTVRELRWPDGITCPSCQSTEVIKPSSTPAAGRPRAGAAGGGLSGAWEDTGAPAGERLGGTGHLRQDKNWFPLIPCPDAAMDAPSGWLASQR